METKKQKQDSFGIKITKEDNGIICGRVFVYFIKNDLHSQPYALIEDLFIEEKFRGKGIGKELVELVKGEALKQNCYKLLAMSREENNGAHIFYEKCGLKKYGLEFRLNF